MSFRTSELRVVCSGLGYPEGLVCMPDGSVLLVELSAGTLSRISPEGQRSVVATMGGSPNGAAIGPDGKVYVCNSGGFSFLYVSAAGISLTPTPGAIAVTADAAPTYTGGSIQRVDLASGTVETIYTEFVGLTNDGTHPLRAPDDLVFDDHGGFWLTDWGHTRGRSRDVTGVCYARADGSQVREVLYPLNAPNGIALSPDGTRLYVAETYTRRVLSWDLTGPGEIARTGPSADSSRLLTADIPGQGILDSMKVDEEGNVYVVTMLPQGEVFASNGGITVIAPSGKILDFIDLSAGGVFDPLPSNVCFGGPDRRTAFITCGGSGRLLACEMRVPGLRPAYVAAAAVK